MQRGIRKTPLYSLNYQLVFTKAFLSVKYFSSTSSPIICTHFAATIATNAEPQAIRAMRTLFSDASLAASEAAPSANDEAVVVVLLPPVGAGAGGAVFVTTSVEVVIAPVVTSEMPGIALAFVVAAVAIAPAEAVTAVSSAVEVIPDGGVMTAVTATEPAARVTFTCAGVTIDPAASATASAMLSEKSESRDEFADS